MKQFKFKKMSSILIIFLAIIALIGTSYSLMKTTNKGTNIFTMNIGSLEVIFLDSQTNVLTLDNNMPVLDEVGLANDQELSFTIKNTGTLKVKYTVYMIETSSDPEMKDVIRYAINKNNSSYKTPKTLGNNNIIDLGAIDVNQEITYKIKVWLSKDADNTYMGKTFTAKIVIDGDVYTDKSANFADTIINKYGIDDTLVAVNTSGELYDGTGEIREYRYSGEIANNYVFFDTNNDGVQDDNELWRIVGVFKNSSDEWNLKLMRNTVLTSDEIPETYTYNGTAYQIRYSDTQTAYWNITNTATNYNDWTTAKLQYFLNASDGYFGTIDSNAQNVVDANYTYYLGNHMYNQDTTISGYTSERDASNIWSGTQATWSGAVALLYPSDYGYSANSSYWSDTALDSYNIAAAAATSWMQKNAGHNISEWFLSPSQGDTFWDRVAIWRTDGDVYNFSANSYFAVRPVLSLKAAVKVIDENRDGTIDEPYQIEIPYDNVKINNQAIYTNDTNVTLTISSLSATTMCISNTTVCSDYVAYENTKNWTLSSEDGIKTVYVYLKDKNDNIISIVNDSIILDTTQPVITTSIASSSQGTNSWYRSLSIKGVATDTETSVTSISSCITTSSTCTPSSQTSGSTKTVSISTSNTTAQKVCFQATDAAGNTSSVTCSNAYKVDVDAPSITNVSDTGSGKITFTASDIHSGVATYCVNQNSTSTTSCSWLSATSGTQTTGVVASTNGNYYVHLKDNAGNIKHSVAVSVTVGLNASTFVTSKVVSYSAASASDFSGGLVAINNSGTLYNETLSSETIREYRFSGLSVNNYVFLDTDGDGVQDDNEIWRIVGIFKNSSNEWNLKLMRNTLLTSDEIPSTYTYNGTSYTIKSRGTSSAYWNITNTATNYNDWTTAKLQYWLNDTTSSGYFGNFSSDAQSKVASNYTYYLGNEKLDYNSGWISDATVNQYTNERSNTACSSSVTSYTYTNGNCSIWNGSQATWNGAVALLYPSDYGYSANSSYWSNTLLTNYGTAATASWMQQTTNHSTSEWLLSPSSSDSDVVAGWLTAGNVGYLIPDFSGEAVRPVINLLSTATFKDNGADGSSSSPYELSI